MRDLNERFLGTTRGRIVALLRQGPQTVHDMAAGLDLSPNAVRSHLVALERDGVIRSAGVRRRGGAGKPASEYELTVEAETRLSRAYPPFLGALLDALADRLERTELEQLLRDVGRRLAPAGEGVPGSLPERAAVAAAALNALGGAAEVVSADGLVIQSRGCPLGAVVARRPEVCGAVRALIADVTGARVRERCERGERARCRFEIAEP